MNPLQAELLNSAVMVALIAAVVGLVGHWVKNRADRAHNGVEQQKVELERQRDDINALHIAVESLASVVEIQGERITLFAAQLEVSEKARDEAEEYISRLEVHINTGQPPPPPPRHLTTNKARHSAGLSHPQNDKEQE